MSKTLHAFIWEKMNFLSWLIIIFKCLFFSFISAGLLRVSSVPRSPRQRAVFTPREGREGEMTFYCDIMKLTKCAFPIAFAFGSPFKHPLLLQRLSSPCLLPRSALLSTQREMAQQPAHYDADNVFAKILDGSLPSHKVRPAIKRIIGYWSVITLLAFLTRQNFSCRASCNSA